MIQYICKYKKVLTMSNSVQPNNPKFEYRKETTILFFFVAKYFNICYIYVENMTVGIKGYGRYD